MKNLIERIKELVEYVERTHLYSTNSFILSIKFL